MPASSLHNRRGFFSDYWLGTMLARRETAAPRLTSAKLDKLLWRTTQLVDRMRMPEPPELTAFREKFARPLLADVWSWALSEATDEPHLRLLHPLPDSGEIPANSAPVAGLWLCPDPDALEDRSPRQRLESLFDLHRLPYGFILTPQTLRLIRRQGDGAKGAAFDVSLIGIAENQDRESLDTARKLLHSGNFLPRDGGNSVIAEMEAESLRHRAKVSAALKDAVFSAAEIVIRGFRADLELRSDSLPPPPSLPEQRDLGLLVLYRLLFILYAESRDERLQTHALYRKLYSLDSLVDRLLRTPSGSLGRNRHELWSLVQTTFRIFDEGLPPLPELENIPPRGGPLFSRQTPAGQWIERLRLCDADVHELLLALATTRRGQGVGRERISYRELAIEQLGSVYEGLLEHEPKVAAEPMFALRVQGREFVLAPAELHRLCAEKELVLAGPAEVLADPLLGRPAAQPVADTDEAEEAEAAAVEEDSDAEADEDDDSDAGEAGGGIKNKAKARVLRRVEPGEFFFAPGSARKSSGSYYTVDEIVQYLCRHALGGLIEGRSPDEILKLRVIDLACGSAHFLVGAARYLGKALWDAIHREHGAEPPPDFSPDHQAARRQRLWEAEGEAWCKRRVVEQCLYGVDLNPTAVQLAQVALWIESLAGDRPLSFFAHHIRHGNSLLGSTLARLDDPPLPDLRSGRDAQMRGLFEHGLQEEIAAALQQRQLIDAPLPPELRPDTPEEYEYKRHRLEEAEKLLTRARLLFDLRSAAAFVPDIWAVWTTLVGASDVEATARSYAWWSEFERIRERERFFHWELEFPEVFLRSNPGFDAVLGNPPWEKVKPDRKEFYARADVLIRAFTGGALDARIRELASAQPGLEGGYADYERRLKTTAACLTKGGDYGHHDWVVAGRRTGGDPDLFKFFVERAAQHLRVGGRFGYLVPSAIYNTDGCTGIRHLLLDRMRVLSFFGFENRRKIFDIDSRYKFVCLTVEKLADDAEPAEGFDATFMRLEVDELEVGPPADAVITVCRSELEAFSPGSLALLEFRSTRDREIVLKMSGLLPGQTLRPLLGGDGEGAWGVQYGAEFHMTNDRALWTKPNGQLWTPREVCGLDWPGDASIPFSEVRRAMAEKGFWPLYEGKHIDQWLTDTKPVTRWLSLEACQSANGKLPSSRPKLVFRDIARNTDERTCIAAVLAERSCANNKLPMLVAESISSDHAGTVLNSISFDYLLRLRISSTINWTYISRVPVPSATVVRGFLPIPTRSAADNKQWHGKTKSARIALANNPEHFEELWRNERAVAQAYGLNAADFAHILASFPVFARKRSEVFGYYQQQCAVWAAET